MSQYNKVPAQPTPPNQLFAINNNPPPQVSKNFDLVMSQMNIADSMAFKTNLAQQWQNAADKKQLLSLVFCEIDFLNEYVQHYGTEGASFMLISVALILKNICDEHNCFLARNDQLGFTVILQGATPLEVQSFADKLCVAIKQSQTEHKYSKIDNFITLSIGISALYPSTKKNLKETAKSRLAIARKEGNRVRVNDIKPASAVSNKQVNTKNPVPVMPKLNQQTNLHTEAPDSIAPILKDEATILSTTYRGQTIKKSTQKKENGAPEVDTNAPNKNKPPRMYRGQIISS
jgi:diguanylate cyclase (GGDEF)-like protein